MGWCYLLILELVILSHVLTVWSVTGTQAASACMLLCNVYRELMRGEGMGGEGWREGARQEGREQAEVQGEKS